MKYTKTLIIFLLCLSHSFSFPMSKVKVFPDQNHQPTQSIKIENLYTRVSYEEEIPEELEEVYYFKEQSPSFEFDDLIETFEQGNTSDNLSKKIMLLGDVGDDGGTLAKAVAYQLERPYYLVRAYNIIEECCALHENYSLPVLAQQILDEVKQKDPQAVVIFDFSHSRYQKEAEPLWHMINEYNSENMIIIGVHTISTISQDEKKAYMPQHTFKLSLPSNPRRAGIFENFFYKNKLFSDSSIGSKLIDKFAQETEGQSYYEINNLCENILHNLQYNRTGHDLLKRKVDWKIKESCSRTLAEWKLKQAPLLAQIAHNIYENKEIMGITVIASALLANKAANDDNNTASKEEQDKQSTLVNFFKKTILAAVIWSGGYLFYRMAL